MALATEIRKTVVDATPIYAAVGVTDVAVERVREIEKEIEHRVRDFDGTALQEKFSTAVKEAPTHAVASALEAAHKAETRYEALAARGKEIVERIRAQRSTQEFLEQGKATVSKTKAAMTTGRKSFDETLAAAKETVTTSRKSFDETLDAVRESMHSARKQIVGSVVEAEDKVETVAEEGAKATEAAATKAATTAKKRAAANRTAAKAAATSAKKTAAKAAVAAKDAAEVIGEPVAEAAPVAEPVAEVKAETAPETENTSA